MGADPQRPNTFVSSDDSLKSRKRIEEGENRVHEALVVSKSIRDGFPTYDFGDHAELLKRCAEPHKHKA